MAEARNDCEPSTSEALYQDGQPEERDSRSSSRLTGQPSKSQGTMDSILSPMGKLRGLHGVRSQLDTRMFLKSEETQSLSFTSKSKLQMPSLDNGNSDSPSIQTSRASESGKTTPRKIRFGAGSRTLREHHSESSRMSTTSGQPGNRTQYRVTCPEVVHSRLADEELRKSTSDAALVACLAKKRTTRVVLNLEYPSLSEFKLLQTLG